jgi:hypothetical protein
MKYYNEPIYKTYKETLPEVERFKDVNVPSSMYESLLLLTSLNIRIQWSLSYWKVEIIEFTI